VIETPEIEVGWIAEELAAEFPELQLHYVTLEARSGRSPATVKQRLRTLADRYTGGKAVTLRQQPIPWAYRVFFRHVGIDPDEQRTPVEAIALERMRAGGFHSRSLLEDALLLATLETGVPVQAFDAANVEGELGLRLAHPRENLGGPDGRPISGGQLVIADSRRSLAILFGEAAAGVGVGPTTRAMLVAAVRVKGVPDVSIEEALWIVVEMLTTPG
jgi:DNA/RNA-binding domain of Phe-tRNA-synthetase-like protein